MPVFSDSNSIDKVEHPYIQLEEKEITLSSRYQRDKGNILKHKLSVGNAFSDNWFGEVSLSGTKRDKQVFDVSSYEIEAKWQITEQGEYSTDYGLLFEYDNSNQIDAENISASLLMERQWGKWIGVANLTGIYEWGTNTKHEFETAIAAQARYRYKPSLEPAIELYTGKINKGIGPVLTGEKRLSPGKKLFWEVGVIFGLDNKSAEQTYRTLLEYEF